MAKFTLAEAFQDIPAAMDLEKKIADAIDAVPPKETRKPSDLMTCAATILTAAGPLADTVEAQVES